MSNIAQLENAPEINFIDNLTLQDTENMVRELYIQFCQEVYGTTPILSKSDPITLLIKTFSMIEYQTMQYINAKGRAELLKTSTGEALEALACLFGIARKQASQATTTVRFTLAQPREEATAIPAGTRVKTQGGKYFHTTRYGQIEAGELYEDIIVQAEEAGSGSEQMPIGGINILVDPIPYVASVSNTDISTGGTDTESDSSLTERVYLAPSKFSCAGPKDAYEYYTKEWRGDVEDVKVLSPSPNIIQICIAMRDAKEGKRLPTQTERESLEEYMEKGNIRPLGDQVVCISPEEVEYSIELMYWIAKSDQRSAGEIKMRIEEEIENYKIWQRTLGRDINPTEIISKVRTAGAKRVKLAEPKDTVIREAQLPKCIKTTIAYGGAEDD